MKALRFLVRLPLLSAILRAAFSEFEWFRRLHGGQWAQFDLVDYDFHLVDGHIHRHPARRIWTYCKTKQHLPHWSLRPIFAEYP